MKIKNVVLFVFLVLMFSTTAFAHESIIVGGDENFPPFEYVDKKNQFKGFNVDIMTEILNEIDVEFEIRPMVWEDGINSLKNGKIDVIQGIKHSRDRESEFVFSKPYLIIADAMFVRSDNKSIVELEDLENKRVAVQKDDMVARSVESIENVEIVRVKDQIEALELVNSGKVDACLINKLTGFYIIQKREYLKSMKMVGEDISPKEYCIAVSFENRELIDDINLAIYNMKEDGRYEKIYQKWFGRMGVPFMEKYAKYIYMAGLVLFILGLVTFMLYLWNRNLKYEVIKRTRAIRAESRFKEQVLNSMYSSIFILDTDGKLIWMNEKACKTTSCKTESLLGNHIWDTKLQPFVGREDFGNIDIENPDTEERELTLDINGVNRVFNYSIHPVFEEGYGISAYTLVIRDVTGEKMLLDKVIAKDKLETLGVLVANISHEIKNPIMIMKSYMDMFKSRYEDPHFVEVIKEELPKEIERLSQNLLNILDYSKPRKKNVERVDLGDVIEESVCFFRSYLVKNSITLVEETRKDANVVADKSQIKQIIGNIIMNSVDALKDRNDSKIKISLFDDNGRWVISIVDNGYGIAKESLTNIFEPFYTTKSEGTGLGLPICQYLVKENSGHMEISSEEGIYTRTDISFPAVERSLK